LIFTPPYPSSPVLNQHNASSSSVSASSSSSSSQSTQTKKSVRRKQPENSTSLRKHRRYERSAHLDHKVDMYELLASNHQTQNEKELFSIYKDRQLSIRFMVSLLSRENDWQRSLALLDWVHEEAKYTPSVFAYNVVLRNVLRAKQFDIAHGLFDEMRRRALAPDRFTYSTLITSFGKEGMFDSALSWLQKMEQDRQPHRALSFLGGCVIKSLLKKPEMRSSGYLPDSNAIATVLNAYGKQTEFEKAETVYRETQDEGCKNSSSSQTSVEEASARVILDNSSMEADKVNFSTVLDDEITSGDSRNKIISGEADVAELVDITQRHQFEPDNGSGNKENEGSECEKGEAMKTVRSLNRKLVRQKKMSKELSLFMNLKASTKTQTMIEGKEDDTTQKSDECRKTGSRRRSNKNHTHTKQEEEIGAISKVLIDTTPVKFSEGDTEKSLDSAYEEIPIKTEEAKQEKDSGTVETSVNGTEAEHNATLSLEEISKNSDNLVKETAPEEETTTNGESVHGFESTKRVLLEAENEEEREEMKTETETEPMGDSKEKEGTKTRLLQELKRPNNFPILAKAGRVEEATWVFRQAFDSGKRYANVIEVFEKMRSSGYFPDSNAIATVLNAYGKQREFEKSDTVYREMQEEGCVFPEEVHFQMLSLYSSKKDFEMVESLFERLESDALMF
ncbi:unnamed protein product, partial [Thlaspi arvense]